MKNTLKLSLLMLLMLAILVGCGVQNKPPVEEQNDKSVSLKGIVEEIKTAMGEDYVPNREIEAEELEMLTQLTSKEYEEFIAEGPMMSTHIDTILGFKAKSGQKDAIVEKLNNYRDILVNDSMQYPMNLAKVEASKVVEHGDYVFFLMLGAFDDSNDDNEAARLEFAQSEVQKVENIISTFFNK